MDLASMWPLDDDARQHHVIAGKSIEQHGAFHHLDGIDVTPGCWLSEHDKLTMLAQHEACSLVDLEGLVLAHKGENGLHLEATSSFVIRYPWNLLCIAEQLVGGLEDNHIDGEVHERATIDGTIHVGEGSRVLPGVYIEGNVTIGKNCKIGPNCFIRGNTSIGDNVVIGQSVEVKNSIIGNNTFISHLSCVGDSIIGDNANIGAGTMVSNYRHDATTHRSMIDDVLVDTGRLKFGTILGNGVRTGINTSIYPGRKIGANCYTLPNQVVQQELH